MWEGVGHRTELKHIDLHSIGHNRVSFPFSWAAQPGTWGPSLSSLQLVWSPNSQSGVWGLPMLGAGFLYRILFPTGLVSKLTDFLSPPSYIIVLRPPSCGRHKIALIQPIHGQGYNILIDRMDLLFTKVNFLFWQPGRVVGQYTAVLWHINHSWLLNAISNYIHSYSSILNNSV